MRKIIYKKEDRKEIKIRRDKNKETEKWEINIR